MRGVCAGSGGDRALVKTSAANFQTAPHSRSEGNALAVFSEIYTREGWRAYIDGEEVRPLRADYILRALELPAGSHTVEWRYRAPHWNAIEAVTLIFSIAVLAAFIITVIIVIRNERRQPTEA